MFPPRRCGVAGFCGDCIRASGVQQGCWWPDGGNCGGIAQTILDGRADAGVICDYSWDGWSAKNDARVGKLAIIARGPKLRDTVVAASGGVDAVGRERFVRGLLALKGNPVILQPPLKARGFVRSTDGDYDPLRAVIRSLEQ